MIDLYNQATDERIGSITEADLQVLVDALEEESTKDRDYFIDQDTIAILAQAGASNRLLGLLRDVVGTSEGVDIRWEEG